MPFVYLHVVWFVVWIVRNTVAPRAFDPYPFGLLTLMVSLEARPPYGGIEGGERGPRSRTWGLGPAGQRAAQRSRSLAL